MIYFDRIEVVNMLVPSAGTQRWNPSCRDSVLLSNFTSDEELKRLLSSQWWK